MIVYTDQYIKTVRAKFPGRVTRLNAQLGEEFELDYKIDIDKEPFKTQYADAISGKVSETQALRFLTNVLEDMERVAKPIFKAEAKAARSWEREAKAHSYGTMIPQENQVDGKDGVEKEIFGTTVSARHLGVLLDISPSMTKYLPKVRAEIQNSFPKAVLIETEGSFVLESSRPNYKWWWMAPPSSKNPFLTDFYHYPIELKEPYQDAWNSLLDAGTALATMVEFGGFDAVYWFTDFDDDMPGLGDLCAQLETVGAKVYIHPLNGRTPALLKRVVKETGGGEITLENFEKPVAPGGGGKPQQTTTTDPALKQKFLASKRRMVDAPFDEALMLVEVKYVAALENSVKKALKTNNQTSADALKRELGSFKPNGPKKDESPADAELQRLRTVYKKLIADEEQIRQENVAKLMKLFPGIDQSVLKTK